MNTRKKFESAMKQMAMADDFEMSHGDYPYYLNPQTNKLWLGFLYGVQIFNAESEPICYASSLPIETPTGLVFPVRKEKDLAHYIPVFSQPAKVAELEARIAELQKANNVFVESILNGTVGTKDLACKHCGETLTNADGFQCAVALAEAMKGEKE